MTVPRLSHPLAEEIVPCPRAVDVWRRLAGLPHCVFLDSAREHAELGRYSFIAAEPFEFVRVPADRNDGLRQVEVALARYQAPTLPGLPPFQGGAAGLLSYDLARSLEELPPPTSDEFNIPAVALGLYDVVIALDHQQNRAWMISHGFPELDPARRKQRAAQRLTAFRTRLQTNAPLPERLSDGPVSAPIPVAALGPQYPVAHAAGVMSNFSPDGYRQAIQRVIDYICAGDAFQVNLAQRLTAPATDTSIALYHRLRQRNAATFAGYFDLGEFQICSASPERLVRLRQGHVEARPIKGTRARSALPEADLFAGDDLRRSEKDRAENVMIVDLLRNDLSRVCAADSVFVSQLCGLESYAFVQHLVSVIEGRLAAGQGPFDLLRAVFPGGSITGAPKVRAMEIISELEPNARGAYCGSLGYVGFDGALDASILIRTITAGRGWWQFPVGGGIVAQSVPSREFEETWDKAKGLLESLHA